MDRRAFLGVVGLGVTGVGSVLADTDGSTQTGRTGQDTTTERATTTSAETTGEEFTGIDSSADRPFTTVSVGTRAGVQNPENNRSHLVRVWNPAESARTIGLRLTRDDGGGPLLAREVEFPADGFLTVRLLEPARYSLAVRPGGLDGTTAGGGTTTGGESAGGTITIPRSRFDCNDSRTDVAVTEDGRVQSTTVTTEIGCPPEVVSRTFTQLRGQCGSANDASVTVGDESVTITGSIQAPNPCYGARLKSVEVGADSLVVTVTTTEPAAGVCVQCVGTIEYEAQFGFRDRVPQSVTVVHETQGGSQTVAQVGAADGGTTRVTTDTTTTAGTTADEETTS